MILWFFKSSILCSCATNVVTMKTSRQSDSTIIWMSCNLTFSMKIFTNMHFWAWKSSNFHQNFHWKHFICCAWPHIMKYTHFHKLFETKNFIAKTGAKTGVFLERNLVKSRKYTHSQCHENAGFNAGFQFFSLIEYQSYFDRSLRIETFHTPSYVKKKRSWSSKIVLKILLNIFLDFCLLRWT